MAWPELKSDFPVAECLAELGATPGMVGIRLIIATESRAEILQTGGYEPYLVAAERNGLAVFVTLPGQVPALQDSVRRHPDLTFVIDHLGLYTPTSLPSGVDPLVGLPEVLALARYPNVTVKCTGVPSLSSQPYPFTDVWPAMHRYLEAFGVERLFWGSDFTRCKPLHTYREAVDFLLSTEEVTAAEKEALFSGSITRWLRWSPCGT